MAIDIFPGIFKRPDNKTGNLSLEDRYKIGSGIIGQGFNEDLCIPRIEKSSRSIATITGTSAGTARLINGTAVGDARGGERIIIKGPFIAVSSVTPRYNKHCVPAKVHTGLG